MNVFNIAELYARDPRKMSDEDFNALILDIRAQRSKFVLGEGSKPAKTKAAAAPSATSSLASRLDIKL